jgi:hypothetical protein
LESGRRPNNNLNTPDECKQSTLEKGDFTRIAETMRESGEALAAVVN